MSTSAAADRCRLTIIAPRRSLDLAVPAKVPLVDVLPAIVDLLGEDASREFAGRGVVLQPLGGEPFDEEQSATALGLRDGDAVYLHPRDAAVPTFPQDDLIDGVADGVRGRANRWTPRRTRLTLRVAAALALAAALPLTQSLLAHAVMAAALLVAAAVTSRGLADRPSALVLGAGAICYSAVAGYLSVPAFPARLAAGAAVAAAVTVMVAVAVGRLQPLVLAVVVAGSATTLGALLLAGGILSPTATAGVVVVIVLLLSPTIPSLAFRLSGMRVPDLPTTAEDITRDVEPVPEAVLTARTALADRYVTAAYAAVAIVAGLGMPLLTGGGRSGIVLALAICALLLLRCRPLTGLWPRWALMAACASGLLAIAFRLHDDGPIWRIGGPALALAIALGLLTATRVPENRPPRPYWGRAAELLESLVALALVPLLLGVLGVYELVRGLGG